MYFSYFFRSGKPNRKKAPKMTSQNPSGTLPGSLREGEIDQLFAPGGPQGTNNDFLAPPGRPRASPGGLRGASGSRVGAEGPPRCLQGTMLVPASKFYPLGPHFPRFAATCCHRFLACFAARFVVCSVGVPLVWPLFSNAFSALLLAFCLLHPCCLSSVAGAGAHVPVRSAHHRLR